MLERLKMSEPSRWCGWSRSRCFFIILVAAVILFFYCTDFKMMASDWTPKWLMEYKTTKWAPPPFRSYNASRYATPSPAPKSTAGVTTLAPRPQTTAKPTQKITVARTMPRQTAPKTTALTRLLTRGKDVKPAAAPYVSPGPYMVEWPYQYHFIINEPKLCEELKPFLVLMVPVAAQNREHRNEVRATWGAATNVQGKTVKLFFILGMYVGDGAAKLQEELVQESKEHRDLVQGDFVDCYKNLTIKTMVMLEWLDTHCAVASYSMKVDSDTFLNVPNLVGMVTNAPKTNYMTGLVAKNALVLRDKTSKWYLPWDVFPSVVYPRYALGLGYVMSLDLPKKLLAASRNVKALYIEDVYLGLCMKHMGMTPSDAPNWNYFVINPMQYNRCSYSRIIVCLPIESRGRRWLWDDFKKPGPYC